MSKFLYLVYSSNDPAKGCAGPVEFVSIEDAERYAAARRSDKFFPTKFTRIVLYRREHIGAWQTDG